MGNIPKLTPAELNQLHKKFWDDHTQRQEKDLKNPSLMKVVNHELAAQAQKIYNTVSEDHRREVLRYQSGFHEIVEAEKKRTSIRNSAHAGKPRPKQKNTVRSLLLAAMRTSKAGGNSLKEFLNGLQDHSTGGMTIQRISHGKTEKFTISIDCPPEELAKENGYFENADGNPSITRSFKTLEDYWTQSSQK